MNGGRTDRDIDAALETWMSKAAPDRPPDRLLEETFARTMRTRQAGTYPWRRLVRTTPGWSWQGSRVVLIVIVMALVIAAVGIGLAPGGGRLVVPVPAPSPSAPIESPSVSASPAFAVVASPSAPTPTVVTAEASVAVDKPIAISSDGQALWVLTEDGRLVRIDPEANEVSDTVALGDAQSIYNGVSADASGVWATRWSPGLVYRIDPETRAIAAKIDTDTAKGMLVAEGAVWVAHTHDGTVSRIDPATNKIVATITVGPTGTSGPNWLASGLGSIWVDIPNALTVVRIDPVTNAVQASIPIPSTATACGGIAVGNDAVWMPSCDASNWLTRIDPTSNAVTAILDMGGRGFLPTIVNDAPWVAVDRGADPASIVRIDPATNQFDRVLSPGDGFRGGGDMVVAAGSMWILDGASNRVLRLPLSAFAP
jgi:YVTN family beta-propeller protein